MTNSYNALPTYYIGQTKPVNNSMFTARKLIVPIKLSGWRVFGGSAFGERGVKYDAVNPDRRVSITGDLVR